MRLCAGADGTYGCRAAPAPALHQLMSRYFNTCLLTSGYVYSVSQMHQNNFQFITLEWRNILSYTIVFSAECKGYNMHAY